MEWYWEVIGYTGTALVILSMMMTSVTKLRVLNICGSVLSTVYAVLGAAWPIVIMNVCLMCINAFHLIRGFVQKKRFGYVRLGAADPTAEYVLSIHKKEIEKDFPEYTLTGQRDAEIHVVYAEAEAVGMLVGHTEDGCFFIEMDYVVPKYRDAVGKFLLPSMKQEGIRRLTCSVGSKTHERYMKKLGFANDGGILIKML